MRDSGRTKQRSSDGIIVISGASSGIGRATAIRLARKTTHQLILAGRNADRLSILQRDCLHYGVDVITCLGDLRDKAYVAQLVRLCGSLRPIIGLVNCAGVGYFGATFGFSDVAWDEIIAINLTATFLLCREIGQIMAGQHQLGTIVNVSSDADRIGFRNAAAYCASKGAVLTMSRALQLEMQPVGVRVSVISPGRVDTHFNQKRPGMRNGALAASDVAEVIEFIITCSANIELLEIRMESMSRVASSASRRQKAD